MWKRNLAFLLAVGLAVGMVFCTAEIAAQPSVDAGIVTEVAVPESPIAVSDGVAEVAKEDPIPVDPTLEQLLAMLLKVVTDFRTVGIIGGFIALIGFLIALLRYKRIDEWLGQQGWKKYKIWIAAGLGGISMFLIALGSGTVWWQALIAAIVGAITGLASTAGHRFLTKGNTKSPKKKKK